MSRVVLSAVQLRRAIENSGGLWTVRELQAIGVLRWGDNKAQLPPDVRVGRLTYFCGYDMVEFAEGLGRAHAAESMHEAIVQRLAETRQWTAGKRSFPYPERSAASI